MVVVAVEGPHNDAAVGRARKKTGEFEGECEEDREEDQRTEM